MDYDAIPLFDHRHFSLFDCSERSRIVIGLDPLRYQAAFDSR